MKHIKRKFLHQFTKDQMVQSGKMDSLKTISIDSKVKLPPGHDIYFVTEQGEYIRGFFFKEKGNNFKFPEPDPILIFFNNAQAVLRQLTEFKSKLFPKSPPENLLTDDLRHHMYSFFGLATNCIICQFLAIESLANRIISDTGKPISQEESNKFTKYYNPDQAQRHLTFKYKIWSALRIVTEKDFGKHYPPHKTLIEHLEKVRNDIVHCKSEEQRNAAYNALFEDLLKFKFEETLKAVRDFINFYKPDLIETCDCGKDF